MELVNPNMVTLARESRGLTQTDLAQKLNVTQAIVSRIESGLFNVSEEMLSCLSNELNYPMSFFSEPANIYPLGVHFYRKAKGIPQKILTRIKAEVNIDNLRIHKLLRSVDIVDSDIPYFDLEDGRIKKPEGVAKAIRHAWSIPSGPISNLADLLESVGIIIVHSSFGTRFFDADSFKTQNGRFVVVANASKPGDRMRFNLAHELGHMLMHRFPYDSAESQANRFAAEFLMPEQDIKPHLSGLTLEKLANLKRHWKVSMQSILMRARDLQRINANQYRYLWMQMGGMGYRLNEPIAIPIEAPTLLNEIMRVHIEKLGYAEGELREMCYLLEDVDLQKYPLGGKSHLKIIPKIQRLNPSSK